MRGLSTILRLPRLALIALVRAYRLLLSPWLGQACRFEPTCSAYAIGALEAHGALEGSYLTLRRIARCQPWCQGGHDPVPPAREDTRGPRRPLFPFPTSDDKKSSS